MNYFIKEQETDSSSVEDREAENASKSDSEQILVSNNWHTVPKFTPCDSNLSLTSNKFCVLLSRYKEIVQVLSS